MTVVLIMLLDLDSDFDGILDSLDECPLDRETIQWISKMKTVVQIILILLDRL